MDKAALVADDREVEARVIAALSRAQIPVTAVEWNWVTDLNEWQLVVVTSEYNSRGPRDTYARIIEALTAAKIYQNTPIGKLYVKSPEDPYAQELVRQLKLTTEGTIHILKNTPGVRQLEFSVVFAPYLGTGGAIPSVRLQNEKELREFLEKRIGIRRYTVDQALSQLSELGNASIFNVQLNFRRARKLNLAA
jgi:hypothetical protein